MALPTYFKNPFITSPDITFSRADIYKRINMTDLIIVPFKQINIRNGYIKKARILSADTRYPGIVYKSCLDPLRHESVTKDYCLFDGTHRLLSMIAEGKTANVFYLITPQHFDGLQEYPNYGSAQRTTGCGGCME